MEDSLLADQPITLEDPLKIELDDEVFVKVVDERIKEIEGWYKKEKKLKERQQKNKDYRFGRQIDEKELKHYSVRYVDNVIFEGETDIKPIALSRLPDLIVKPGSDIPESKETAEKLTKVINSDTRKRENRLVLGLAFKHQPVYFVGAIKYRWDPKKGEHGDFVFEVVHPDNLILDNVPSTNPDDMQIIVQKIKLTAKEALMRFPDKKEELLTALSVDLGGEPVNESKLATKIDIQEVWFTWYNKVEKETGEEEYERIEGVAWKYQKVLLRKMKNPNWDWEGEQRTFRMEAGEEIDVGEEEFRQALMMGELIPGLRIEQVYNNHFENPRKPYILLNYETWGEMPYDETSRIEQVLYLQDNVNKRGKQISEIGDRTRGKNVFSTDSGLDKTALEELDMDDPTTDLLVHGDLNKVHREIKGEQPDAALFQEQAQNRQKILSQMGVHDTTRGEITTDTATTAQIAREADYGAIDDLTEDTINFAAEEMANASMQMIKLRYTEDHFRKILGTDGETIFVRLNRDLIEDGMEITVHASGTDKIIRKREAYEKAKLNLIDPLSFLKDTDSPDPEERAKMLIQFQNQPELYYQTFIEKRGTPEMVEALGQQPGVAPQGVAQGAVPPGPGVM